MSIISINFRNKNHPKTALLTKTLFLWILNLLWKSPVPSSLYPLTTQHEMLHAVKNLEYGRHWISRRVQLVAPIPLKSEKFKLKQKKIVSCFQCQVWGVRCQVSHVACHLSHVTNANSNSHRPLLTPPLCTAGWFAKTQSSTFYRRVILHQFWAKIANSETNVLS